MYHINLYFTWKYNIHDNSMTSVVLCVFLHLLDWTTCTVYFEPCRSRKIQSLMPRNTMNHHALIMAICEKWTEPTFCIRISWRVSSMQNNTSWFKFVRNGQKASTNKPLTGSHRCNFSQIPMQNIDSVHFLQNDSISDETCTYYATDHFKTIVKYKF